MADVIKLSSDEYFSHIPFPKLVRLSGRGGIRFEVELLVRRYEKDVKLVVGPARSDLRLVAGRQLSPLIILREHAFHGLPVRRIRIRRELQRFSAELAFDSARPVCQTHGEGE